MLYAIWGYEVIFNTKEGDPVPRQKIQEGKKATLVGAKQKNKAFVWWYTSPTLEVNTRYDFDKEVTEHMTLYAKWDDASKYIMNENKITYVNGASSIVEIPYSVLGYEVTGVERSNTSESIFINVGKTENTTVTQVILPNNITSIGPKAFHSCTALTSINIPSGVTSIGNGAFYNCSALTSITIPSSVSSIGHQAFFYCSSLTSVTIPSGVTSIGDYAFLGCTQLSNLRVEAETPPTLGGTEVFKDTPSNLSITVPAASVNLYKANWSAYASKITGY